MGGYEFSEATVGDTKVTFGLLGDFSHKIIKEEFSKVLEAQQEIVGVHPAKNILVIFQPTTSESAKGTSLRNALVVNVPSSTKLEPFNFQIIGTVSHELFHQWNAIHLTPANEEGAYLFTEGFTNYFAVAALVRAQLIPEKTFGRFLCRYRKFLESNPSYPGADFEAMQKGLSKDEKLFDLTYTKGPLVAVLLDLALREDTNGQESIVSWFRALDKKFAGTKGYVVKDLRQMVSEVSGKKDGKAAKVFAEAFLGGGRLKLDPMFAKLGVTCSKEGEAELNRLSGSAATLRTKVFSASE